MWVLVTNSSVTASSSLVAMPARPLPPRRLRTESLEGGALDIAGHGDGYDHLLALDQRLVVDTVERGGYLRPARRGKLVADFLKLGAHHGVKLDAVGKDFEQF